MLSFVGIEASALVVSPDSHLGWIDLPVESTNKTISPPDFDFQSTPMG